MNIRESASIALRNSLSQISSLSDDAWNAIEPYWEFKNLKQGEYLHKIGEPATLMAYVMDGALREYFLTFDGVEFNKAFVFSGEFTGSFFDLMSDEVSTASVQAIKPCKMLVAPYEVMHELYDQFDCFQRLGRIVAEGLFIKKAQREHAFLTMDAQSRYLAMIKQYPNFEKELPQYHLASYLGITPVALSRIRSQLKKGFVSN
ncbi:MAG: Crp/Fnr family transcriptional regulator [Alteromonadaceae bacterium]|nr:MAG: Crp/Fnr family transcriptional regulator [Alteromonadaceae bacterium]